MSITTAADEEKRSLLPTTAAVDAKDGRQPHALLGMACVALSAVCFSLMSTLLKYNTYSMSSLEAIFWRSVFALLLNYVSMDFLEDFRGFPGVGKVGKC